MTKMSGVLATLSKRPTGFYHQLWQNPKKGCFLVILACFGPFGPECQKGQIWAEGAKYYPISPWYGPCPGQGCSGVLIGERGQKGSKGVKRAKTPLFTCRIMGIPGPVLARCAQMTQNDPFGGSKRGQKGSKGVKRGQKGPYTILLPPGMGHALARGAQMAQKGSK
jgi:hypothetical protein